jgi:hypothetical protein
VEAGHTTGSSSNLAHQAWPGNDRSRKACGQRSSYTPAGKSRRGWGLLSVWVDRQCSNKVECHVAEARRVVMACGLAFTLRKELKDKSLLALRAELAVTV